MARCITLNISAERTNDAEPPDIATYIHSTTITATLCQRCPCLMSIMGVRSNVKTITTMPRWSPESAIRCDSPVREYASRRAPLSRRREPTTIASTVAWLILSRIVRSSLRIALLCRVCLPDRSTLITLSVLIPTPPTKPRLRSSLSYASWRDMWLRKRVRSSTMSPSQIESLRIHSTTA